MNVDRILLEGQARFGKRSPDIRSFGTRIIPDSRAVMLISRAIDRLRGLPPWPSRSHQFAESHERQLHPELLFVAPAHLHPRWYALDDDWVKRLGRRRAWVEPVRAALALEIRDVWSARRRACAAPAAACGQSDR